VAARSLLRLGLDHDKVTQRITKIAGPGDRMLTGHIAFSPRSKKVLELALREALRLGHGSVTTEHLLLGLIREGQGLAAQVMTGLGVNLDELRKAVLAMMVQDDMAQPPAPGRGRDVVVAEVQAVFDENEHLKAEVERLNALLRRHGIDPGGDPGPASASA
jgi:ATP-dependent Clp protease ATP-binding subunit ClpA